jgi:DNA-directed RNA polymerase specialized sigma24 family protein
MRSERHNRRRQSRSSRKRRKQAAWNQTQFLALSAEFMQDSLEDLAVSACSEPVGIPRHLKIRPRLDPLQRRILELHVKGGLSIKETATVLNTSEEDVLCALSVTEEWLGRAEKTASKEGRPGLVSVPLP